METKNNVLIIVVTYNRLPDLKVCVSALRSQSYNDFDILVVNNGSSDGTKDWIDSQKDLLAIHQQNVGGAGGFYSGMKYMMEHDYQWLLMMDDDGVADKDELKNLLGSYEDVKKAVGKEVILNALVVNKDDYSKTSFIWARGSNRSNEISELKNKPFFKDIHPFNGTLVKRDIIDKIGLIKKEMFIWGDEKEYMARAIHNGIGLYTVTSAIHYHPKEKGIKGNIIPFVSKYQLLIKPRKMSHYYYRNEGYIYGTYPERRKKMPFFVGAYILRFITHGEFGELLKFLKYFRRGTADNFQ
jgi:rhamnopyranosyl-N-acetylglucosaminyl-diphospho-decaprenol beta-1,3/1,4-galactofuranosyltransferase